MESSTMRTLTLPLQSELCESSIFEETGVNLQSGKWCLDGFLKDKQGFKLGCLLGITFKFRLFSFMDVYLIASGLFLLIYPSFVSKIS